MAGVGQHRHQRQNVFLKQRFAAGDFDQRAAKPCDGGDDLIKRLLFPFVKRVFGVAIIAAEIAKRHPDEDTRLAGPGAFALDRMVNLVNRQRLFHSALDVGRSPRRSPSAFRTGLDSIGCEGGFGVRRFLPALS